jgi:hypothetical protein
MQLVSCCTAHNTGAAETSLKRISLYRVREAQCEAKLAVVSSNVSEPRLDSAFLMEPGNCEIAFT